MLNISEKQRQSGSQFLITHLPLLLNADRSKLSKRQGDVAVEDYRAKGYLRDAIVNFVAFLGWNPGDEREIFSIDELIRDFSLERVGKAGAVFNVEKLLWLNQQHLRFIPPADLVPQVAALVAERGWDIPSHGRIERAIILSRDNIIRVDDLSLPIGPQSYTEPLAPIDPSAPRLGSAVLMVDIEKAHIHGVLNSVSWNKNIAAKILGISLKTLYTKIRQYDLTKG